MMKFDTLKEAVHFRVVENEDDYWVEDYWKVTIELFTRDVTTTIMFLKNDCDDEELYFLSEIFEEIVEQTQSKDIISVLRSRLSKVKPENYNQENFKSELMRKWVDYNEYIRSVQEEINYAEGRIHNSEHQKTTSDKR